VGSENRGTKTLHIRILNPLSTKHHTCTPSHNEDSRYAQRQIDSESARCATNKTRSMNQPMASSSGNINNCRCRPSLNEPYSAFRRPTFFACWRRIYSRYLWGFCGTLYVYFASLSSQHSAFYASLRGGSVAQQAWKLHRNPATRSDFDRAIYTPPHHTTNRTAPLHPYKQFSFIHISKCAGGSWIEELRRVLSRPFVFPRETQGHELAVAYQEIKHPNSDYLLIALKSPRQHVFSMFHECKYKKWGDETNETNAGHAFDPNMSDDESFEMWLSYFVKEAEAGSGSFQYNQASFGDKFKCYHPSNFQSRYLSSKDWNAQAMDRDVGFEPDTGHALRTLHQKKMVWVGLSDFFHESKCLLYYRLLLGVVQERNNSKSKVKTTWDEGINEGTTQKVTFSVTRSISKGAGDPRLDSMQKTLQSYINQTCVCPALGEESMIADTNSSASHQNGNTPPIASTTIDYGDVRVHPRMEGTVRQRTMDPPKRILDMVAALTRSDTFVYKDALSNFIREIVWLEQMLQNRVLCDSTLHAAEPKLAYLGLNVTEMYHWYAQLTQQQASLD
jgi:hypothetical protein